MRHSKVKYSKIRRSILIFLLSFSIFLLITPSILLSQASETNLIPNPSFEQTVQFPPSDWIKERHEFNNDMAMWKSPTDATPDIFKGDDFFSFSFQIQGLGLDKARTGETMVGITTFVHSSSNKLHKREYLQIPLNAPLSKNKTYKISTWVKSPKRTLRSSHLGFLFSRDSFYLNTVNQLSLTPHFQIDTIISADEWQKVEFTFSPKENAQYLTIGNFEKDENVQFDWIAKKPVLFAYYYFDDVEIVEIEQAIAPKTPKAIELPKLEKGKIFALENIHFEFDKATLLPSSFPELEKLVAQMNRQPDFQIEIRGHTDNHGNDDYNQKLSEARAKSVVEYLISKGISQQRLTAKGYGESIPIAENTTENGRQLNRRVELLVLD